MGSKQLGLDFLKTMFRLSKETLIGALTFDDTSDTRTKFDEIIKFCQKEGIHYHVVKSRNHSEEIIREQNPDICIVAGWYWLFGSQTLKCVPHGLLGIHNSLLPKYRGGAPLVWSIINDEPRVGFSMFILTEGMDDGDILFQYDFELTDNDDVGDILINIERQAVKTLEKNYQKILNGQLKPVPQNHAKATYCTQRRPEDGLIDWNKSAREVFNFIRAQSKPYPGAYTIYNGSKLIMWDAIINKNAYFGIAGQVAKISKEGVTVICGDNRSIMIKNINSDGKNLRSNELIRSIKTRFQSN